VEVYEPDLVDLKQQEVLAEARLKLKKNLTWWNDKEIPEKH
jgi:hypothetical protein